MRNIPLCTYIPLIYRYGHACQIKLLLLLPEKRSRRESASSLKLLDFSYTQATTLGRDREQDDHCGTTYNLGRISVFFIYLFIIFCPKALLLLARIGKIKLLKWKRNCVRRVPYDICKRNRAHQMENNAQKRPNRVKGRIIIRSANGWLLLDWLSQWIIFPQPYD